MPQHTHGIGQLKFWIGTDLVFPFRIPDQFLEHVADYRAQLRRVGVEILFLTAGEIEGSIDVLRPRYGDLAFCTTVLSMTRSYLEPAVKSRFSRIGRRNVAVHHLGAVNTSRIMLNGANEDLNNLISALALCGHDISWLRETAAAAYDAGTEEAEACVCAVHAETVR